MSAPFLTTSDTNTMREMLEVDILDDIYLKNNLLAWMPKGPGEGDVWKVPLRIGGTTQHGADDVAGIAGVSGARPQFDAFLLNWFPTYGFAEVPMTAIALSMNKESGCVPLLVDAVRDARKACARDVELGLAGDGYGTRGVIASNTGSGPYVLTLTNISDASVLNLGDTLVSATSPTASSLDTGSATITAIDRDAGTVTVAAVNSWSPTNGNYLFLTLDKVSALGFGNPSKCYGLSAFIPTANRTSTFSNVDRSVDPQNLAGCYMVGSATDIRGAINQMLAKLMPKANAFDGGGMIWMSANTLMALQTQLNNSVKYTDVDVEGTVNFPGIEFQSVMGKAKASFAAGIADNLIYVLTRDAWLYGSPIGGDIVQSATNLGKDYVDSYNKVAAQVRQWSFGQLRCNAPGLNGVIKLQ